MRVSYTGKYVATVERIRSSSVPPEEEGSGPDAAAMVYAPEPPSPADFRSRFARSFEE